MLLLSVYQLVKLLEFLVVQLDCLFLLLVFGAQLGDTFVGQLVKLSQFVTVVSNGDIFEAKLMQFSFQLLATLALSEA